MIQRLLLFLLLWSPLQCAGFDYSVVSPDQNSSFQIEQVRRKKHYRKEKVFEMKVDPKDLKHTLSICAIFRDGARFLKGWIEYHRMMGVDYFYLNNNLSQDEYLEVLTPYIEEGIVELIDVPIETIKHLEYTDLQIGVYNSLLYRLKKETLWAAIIDIDEYIVLPGGKTIPEFLENYEGMGGVVMSWQLYGTSHVQRLADDELVLEHLVYRGKKDHSGNYHFKTIVNPRKVIYLGVHGHIYLRGNFGVNEKKEVVDDLMLTNTICKDQIYVAHYTEGDEDYFYSFKAPFRQRWFAYTDPNHPRLHPDESLNEVYDPIMLQYVPELKRRMNP